MGFKAIKLEAGIDQKLSEDGVWHKIYCIEGFEVKLARAGTKAWERLNNKLLKVHREIKDRRPDYTISTEDGLEILVKQIVETSLKDWRNLPDSDEDGNLLKDKYGKQVYIPFSKKTAYEMLRDPELRPVLEEFNDCCKRDRAYRLEATKKTEQDLPNMPDGVSGTDAKEKVAYQT